MIATGGLAIAFGKSRHLAAAYGIAVSATKLMTTVLLFIATREILRWSLPAAAALAGVFLVVDTAFFGSNLTKIAEGGWVPLLFAGCVYSIMMIWHVGAETVAKRVHETVQPIGKFLAAIRQDRIPRVRGTAVLLTQSERDGPQVMVWHVKHNRSLHERVFVLQVIAESIPWVRNADRLEIDAIAPNFWHGRARYGFMEHPNIPALLRQARDKHSCDVTLDDITYYLGHATIIHREHAKALPRSLEAIFAFMHPNSLHTHHYFLLP